MLFSRFFFVVILSLLFTYIKQNKFFQKKYILILVDLYESYKDIFLAAPDPDKRFLKWIRIRPIYTDPTGS